MDRVVVGGGHFPGPGGEGACGGPVGLWAEEKEKNRAERCVLFVYTSLRVARAGRGAITTLFFEHDFVCPGFF